MSHVKIAISNMSYNSQYETDNDTDSAILDSHISIAE